MSWPLTLTLAVILLVGLLLTTTPSEPSLHQNHTPSPLLTITSPSLLPSSYPHNSEPSYSDPDQEHLPDYDDFAYEDDKDDFNTLPNHPTPLPTSTAKPSPPTTHSRIAGSTQDLHQIIRVIDGDTVELASGETVRLIGIDTPESVHLRQPVACFGKEAANFTRQTLQGQYVRLEHDVTDRDRYGRLLRYLYLNDQFINEYLVAQGYATSYPYPPDVKYQSQLKAAEDQARSQQLGLWSACSPASESHDQATANLSSDPTCRIKGNINSNQEKIYHLPDCPYYTRTSINSARGEQYFCTIEEAEAADWRRAQNCP